MSLRVRKVLYRSFLRWNRSPAIVNSTFSIDPGELGIKSLLPAGVHSISNKEGVHGAISYCFRQHQSTSNLSSSEQIDLGFETLKYLNTYGQKLKERYNQRVKNSSPDVYSKAVYHVGQTVCHTDSSCRCVVIGWDIDLSTGKQSIECLADLSDIDEMVAVGSNYPAAEEFYDSSAFAPISDVLLKRIYNPSLLLYFTDFDIVQEQFTPTEDLLFLYPSERFESKAQRDSKLNNNKADVGHNSGAGDGEKLNYTDMREAELKASQSIINSVSGLGALMMKIVEKHHLLRIYRFAEKLVYVDETLKETQSLEDAMKQIEGDRFTSRFAAQEDTVNAVMSDVCSTIKRCAAFSSHPTATATANTTAAATATAQHDSASASDSTKGSALSFEDSILRPTSASTIKNSSKFATWRNGSLERLLRDNVTVDSSTGLTQHAGRREAASHRGTGSAQEASEALDALTSCFLSIDQMLQLRFQMKGAAHFETLAGISAASSTFTPSSPSSSSAAVSPQDSEDEDKDKDADKDKEELMTPAAVYEVGQILLHKKFGYRCIVVGWDIRPLADVSKWEAVVGSVYGSEQPFYRAIADEDDVQNFLGEGQFRPTYYVAQENLTPVPEDQLQPPLGGCGPNALGGVIKHRHLPMFFTKYNDATKRYGVLPKQLFCFPSNISDFDIPILDGDSDKNVDCSDRNQHEGFKSAEALLLELYFLLKSSYSRTNCQPYCLPANEQSDAILSNMILQELKDSIADNDSSSSGSGGDRGDCLKKDPIEINKDQESDLKMADLLTLLKMSSRRDVAVVFESTIWHAWMAHHDPQVNKAMRLGISNLVRNDVIAAHDNFMEATLRDPFYPEAHNKLAAMYHKAGQYSACEKRATIALSYCPFHYGALAGLGMSLEKAGNVSGAESAFRKSLTHHPWAGHVPTVLWTVLMKENEKKMKDAAAALATPDDV